MLRRIPSTLLKFVVLTAVLAVLAACGGKGSAKPAEPAAAATAAPVPTQKVEAPAPTMAPKSTEAPKPTEAPAPTATAAPAPTAAPRPTAAPAEAAPIGEDALKLLTAVMRAQLAAKSWRSTTNIEDGGKVTKSVVEFVAPGSMHMITGTGTEMIILKEGSYQKAKSGEWQKSAVDMSSLVSQVLDPKNVEEIMKTVTVDKVKFLGPQLLDARPTWLYQYTTTTKMGDLTIVGDAKLWIGVLDKLPYRLETVSDSVVNKGGKSNITSTYEYDPNIKIEAPIK